MVSWGGLLERGGLFERGGGLNRGFTVYKRCEQEQYQGGGVGGLEHIPLLLRSLIPLSERLEQATKPITNC